MIAYKQIKEVHLEISTLCNAACPQCPRNFNGYTHNDGYPETYMTLEQAQKIFKPDFLKQLRKIYINGNYGDIVMNPDGPAIVEYFAQTSPRCLISVSTNGGARDKEWWQRLARARTRVFFCLDGLEDTHHLYRQNTRYNTVIKNALTFIGAGGNAVWKCIKFKHNEHQIEEMRQLAKDFGFKRFELIDHGRDTGPVFSPKGELTHVLGDYTGSTNFEELFYNQRSTERTVENIASRWDPEKDDYSLHCETLEFDRIYIAANGDIAPCCFMGFYPKTFGENSYMQALNSQIFPLMYKYNALRYDIGECVEWFQQIPTKWKEKNYKSGRLLVCDEICGRCNNES